MSTVTTRTVSTRRPSGRRSAPPPESRFTPRTITALVVLVVVLGVFAVTVLPRFFGPSGATAATPATGEADRDTEFLRALPIEQLRQEQKKRAAEVSRLVNAADPPRDQLAAARDAAFRASATLAEKDPKRDR